MKTLTIYSTNALQKVQRSHFLAKSNTHIRQCIHQRAKENKKCMPCMLLSIRTRYKQKYTRRQRSGIDTIMYHNRPRTPYGNVTKTQGNITYKRNKMSALSQRVITRLQITDKTVIKKNVNIKQKGSTKYARSVKHWRAKT